MPTTVTDAELDQAAADAETTGATPASPPSASAPDSAPTPPSTSQEKVVAEQASLPLSDAAPVNPAAEAPTTSLATPPAPPAAEPPVDPVLARMERLEQMLGTVVSTIDSLKATPTKPASALPETPTAFPETVEDLTKLIDSHSERQAAIAKQQREKYESEYVASVIKLSERVPKEERPDVEKELLANFNKVLTGDPVRDAETNYSNAERSFLRKKSAKPIAPPSTGPSAPDTRPIPLRNQDANGVGIDGGSRNDVTSAKAIELDEVSREFVAKTKMSEKSQLEALTGPIPTYLSGKVRA